jgi:chromatin segregation and condensation protein Rec8/ScpA/Scc1 (kleisin family)
MNTKTENLNDITISPLEVIFQLLEKKNLDFTNVSLVKITDDFLYYIQEKNIETIAIGDYLEALSKLLLLKINHLLKIVEPQSELRINLERFKYVRQARNKLRKLWEQGPVILSSQKLTTKITFAPPKITIEDLISAINALLSEPIIEEKEIILKKKIHIKNALKILEEIVNKEKEIVLQDKFKEKSFLTIIFLASLLLYQEQTIQMEQESIFDKIIIRSNRE